MTKIDECYIKPVCGDTAHGSGIVGVEDGCRQESVSVDPCSIPFEYLQFVDTCTCEGENKFQKMCTAGQQRHSLFRAEAQPAKEMVQPKPIEEATVESEEVDESDEPSAEEHTMEMAESLRDAMEEMDSEGFITGVDIKMQDDGTATLNVGYISPPTGDALADGDESIWGNVAQDQEYMEELSRQANRVLPDGWTIDEGSHTDLPIEWVNGRPVPLTDEEGTYTFKLKPSA